MQRARRIWARAKRPSGKPRVNLLELGRRVQEERTRRRMSLAQLSQRSRVSRSMISAIERGVKAATVVTLDRIATGLDTSLSRLLEPETQARVILLPHAGQKVARAGSGWERRILSPVLPGVEFEFMRTTIAPGVNAGTFLAHARGSREYVAVEKGTLLLTLDGSDYSLTSGDSIYYDGDCQHGFRNPAGVACVYYLAMDVSGDRNGPVHRRVSAAQDQHASARQPDRRFVSPPKAPRKTPGGTNL